MTECLFFSNMYSMIAYICIRRGTNALLDIIHDMLCDRSCHNLTREAILLATAKVKVKRPSELVVDDPS